MMRHLYNLMRLSQYHTCCCPGGICRQGVIRYDIDYMYSIRLIHCVFVNGTVLQHCEFS